MWWLLMFFAPVAMWFVVEIGVGNPNGTTDGRDDRG